MLKDMWRKNTAACVVLIIFAVCTMLIMIFSRASYVKSWAYSQGFTYDSNYDYKFAKKFLYFDAVGRGQKSYAFNTMKGEVDFTNKSAGEEQKSSVQAFDFCYTEIKTFQQNKRVNRMEKTHEFSAVVFDAFGYSFKPTIVTPREMQVDFDSDDLPVQQADPDVEELLKGPQKDKDDDEDGDKIPAAAAGNTTENATAAEEKKDDAPGAPQVADESAIPDTSEEEAEPKAFNDTHPLSAKFNVTFKVEASDHVQAEEVMSPAMKQLLLDHPNFFVDFQEDQIMLYREYTIEPKEFTAALELGKAILSLLPNTLPVNETVPEEGAKKKAVDSDISVFVSKSEL